MNSRIAELERAGVIDFTRQRDWFDPTTINSRLTIVGGGGIGSMFTLLAGKLGVGEIVVYDDDLVEPHNLPNQLFPLDQVGFRKVDALGQMVEQFTVATVDPQGERVTADTRLRGIVVSGVDSMEARQEIAKAVHASRFTVPRYWDARLGGEKVVIYSVNPKDPEEWKLYEKTLYSDEEAESDPCTRRSVVDVMGHVGSHLMTGVRQHLGGETPAGFVYHHVGEGKLFSGPLSMGVTPDGV